MLIGRKFFSRHPVDCARDLIGCEMRWDGCSGIVVETEAYAEHGDEACHTFIRRQAREFVAENPPGTAYVYLNYGVHWLANVLIKGGCNGFVLIRALEPCKGIREMRGRRGGKEIPELCSGPGKLTQALGIDGSHHGFDFCGTPARAFHRRKNRQELLVMDDVRIGISKEVDLRWRFLLEGSPHVSKKVVRPKK